MGRSFSYQGQDLFVLEATEHQRDGYFIDSGASDGIRGSNTKLLESEYGWQGICVEPNAAFFAELLENRSCACLNCCLYDREGPVEFLEAAEVYGGIVQEFEPERLGFVRAFAVRAAGGERRTPAPALKQARTIRSVLRACGAPHVIDYWSLDTEGSELALLRSFPFDEYRLRFLTVEHNYSSSREEIRALLASRGFSRVRSLGIDDCYAYVGNRGSRAWRSRAWTRAR